MLDFYTYLALGICVLVTLYWFIFRGDGDDDLDDIDIPDEGVGGRSDGFDDENDPRPRMTLFFGSQMGTAEMYAIGMAKEAEGFGFRARAMDLVDVDDPEEAMLNETLCVFLVATYGEGDPTDNARDFHEWLTEADDSELLKDLQYCVFGLGNKQYKKYQAMGKFFDEKLEKLGAKRVFKLGAGDADDNMDEDFDEWRIACLTELSSLLGTTKVEDDVVEKQYQIKFVNSNSYSHLPFVKSGFGKHPDVKSPFLSTALVHEKLLPETSERSTVQVEFDIKGSNIKYEAGDHLAVFAENPPALIQRAIDRLEIDHETLEKCFSLEKIGERRTYFNKRTTVRSALTHLIDLQSHPKKPVFRVLAEYAELKEEKESLLLLASNSDEGKKRYNEHIKSACRNMIDVLEEFESIKLPLDHFLEVMPRMQPRYYSIASSSHACPDSIRIVVSVVRYTADNVMREGLCSAFLERLAVGGKAYVFVRESTFHLPSELSKPVIMVGPGTGLAPLLGFMQQRRALIEKQKKTLGKGYLFFGCRQREEDFIFEAEQKECAKDGVICKLFVAFSREKENKVYVQHLMKENGELMREVLVKQGGYLYVCGDAKHMAKEVESAIVDIMHEEGMTRDEALTYVDEMRTNKRYLSDVWSA